MDNLIINWLWYDSSDSTTEDLKEHYSKEKLMDAAKRIEVIEVDMRQEPIERIKQ